MGNSYLLLIKLQLLDKETRSEKPMNVNRKCFDDDVQLRTREN